MRIVPIGFNPLKLTTQKTSFQEKPILPALKCDTGSFGATANQAKKVIILLGAPNSGKGTYGRRIAEKYAIPQISTGDILRGEVKKMSKLGLEAKRYMESGGLVPDELIMKIFQQRILEKDCQRGFILDGFPRTINQAEQLDEILKKDKNIALKIVNLDVDRDILFARSANRYICADCSKTHAVKEGYNPETSKCDCGGKLIKRADDTPEVLASRLDSYEKQTLPLVDYYGEQVSNVGVYGKDSPIDEILDRINKVLEK
jgi:adenylate kinase